MLTEDKQALIARWGELWATGNLSIADEIVTADFVLHDGSSPTEIRGPERLKRWVRESRTGSPDLRFTPRAAPMAEGDRAATEWTMRGTHTGPFLGIAPTGKAYEVDGVDIFRFSDRKIAENWSFWDELPLYRRLGVMPEMKRAA